MKIVVHIKVYILYGTWISYLKSFIQIIKNRFDYAICDPFKFLCLYLLYFTNLHGIYLFLAFRITVYITPYYGLFIYDIQVSVLRMEINQASEYQSV